MDKWNVEIGKRKVKMVKRKVETDKRKVEISKRKVEIESLLHELLDDDRPSLSSDSEAGSDIELENPSPNDIQDSTSEEELSDREASANNQNSKLKRRQFIENLAMKLIEPHIRERQMHLHLPWSMRQRLSEILKIDEVPGAAGPSRNGRCFVCGWKK
ncbi:unnamed protein product [Parnassius apollo]|uniref:(apollo) hypothetical protein n=1 Tax=Parnassius apollo TaxID=110799 RepID=A0A8S3XDM8_PARAO|nr:unnamed protein product [Parnassius apollo]